MDVCWGYGCMGCLGWLFGVVVKWKRSIYSRRNDEISLACKNSKAETIRTMFDSPLPMVVKIWLSSLFRRKNRAKRVYGLRVLLVLVKAVREISSQKCNHFDAKFKVLKSRPKMGKFVINC